MRGHYGSKRSLLKLRVTVEVRGHWWSQRLPSKVEVIVEVRGHCKILRSRSNWKMENNHYPCTVRTSILQRKVKQILKWKYTACFAYIMRQQGVLYLKDIALASAIQPPSPFFFHTFSNAYNLLLSVTWKSYTECKKAIGNIFLLSLEDSWLSTFKNLKMNVNMEIMNVSLWLFVMK